MNHKVKLFAAVVLALWPCHQSLLSAQQNPPSAERKTQKVDIRALLEKGRGSGSLPKGLVIRVSACLGVPKEKTSGNPLPEGLRETWEFTSDQVRGVGTESEAESRPFDSKNLCREFLEGKVIEIGAGKGEGPKIGFVETSYQRGSRSIELDWNGVTILNLLETNGPFLKFFKESDARAFGTLHEKLLARHGLCLKRSLVKQSNG